MSTFLGNRLHHTHTYRRCLEAEHGGDRFPVLAFSLYLSVMWRIHTCGSVRYPSAGDGSTYCAPSINLAHLSLRALVLARSVALPIRMFYADPGYEVYLDGYSTLGEKTDRRFALKKNFRASSALPAM